MLGEDPAGLEGPTWAAARTACSAPPSWPSWLRLNSEPGVRVSEVTCLVGSGRPRRQDALREDDPSSRSLGGRAESRLHLSEPRTFLGTDALTCLAAGPSINGRSQTCSPFPVLTPPLRLSQAWPPTRPTLAACLLVPLASDPAGQPLILAARPARGLSGLLALGYIPWVRAQVLWTPSRWWLSLLVPGLLACCCRGPKASCSTSRYPAVPRGLD